MASIIKTVEIDAPAEPVWDAVADFGAVHERFAPGFVTHVELVPGGRMVTFGDGTVVKELFLGSDEGTRRLAYSAQSELLEHHSASFQVTENGAGRCRLTWAVDVLPDAMAPFIEGRMVQGLAVAQQALAKAA